MSVYKGRMSNRYRAIAGLGAFLRTGEAGSDWPDAREANSEASLVNCYDYHSLMGLQPVGLLPLADWVPLTVPPP